MIRPLFVAAPFAVGLAFLACGSSPSSGPEGPPRATSFTEAELGGGASVLAIAGLVFMNRRKDESDAPR